MKNKFRILLLVLCIILSFIYIMTGAKDTKSTLSSNIDTIDTSTYNALYTGDELIAINISGSVNNPDIYILNKGATLKDAIGIAGGAKENADFNKINLDKVLDDKEVIIVPSINNEKQGENELININTASKEKLMELPHIGEVTASDIIEYREKVSLFYNTLDIKKVKNIGDKTYNKIKDLITIK